MSVDFGGDESISIRIERRGRLHLVLETALERERGRGREAHHEIPERSHQQLLERETAGQRRAERHGGGEHAADRHARSTEADQQAEQHPRRREIPQPRNRATGLVPAASPRMPGAAVPVGTRMRVSVAAEAGERHREQADGPYGEGE